MKVPLSEDYDWNYLKPGCQKNSLTCDSYVTGSFGNVNTQECHITSDSPDISVVIRLVWMRLGGNVRHVADTAVIRSA
jgi:hypothetical protein